VGSSGAAPTTARPMSPHTPNRDDESPLDRPRVEWREASRGVGLGVTAIFLVAILAVVVVVVVLA
jgi:hypothetical protein